MFGSITPVTMGSIFFSVPILIIFEWINRNEKYGFCKQPKNKILRWLCYEFLALMIIELHGVEQVFMYFRI
jgi:hypothetical protein